MNKNPRKKPKTNRLLILVLAVAVVVAGICLYIRYRNTRPRIFPEPQPTITQLPNTPASDGTKSNTTQGNRDGTATDTNGQQSGSSTPSNQWIQSQSGVITLKQPVEGSTLKSGSEIFGSAKAPEVQFRLTDNQTGVIARGTLKVVGGNFSGTLNYTATGKNGRLDVFTVAADDREINEVQANVSFQ